ncbi:MAG: hypothetical protein JSS99_03110 [Actinobacteria bacterium]|nr:hypothetical protein [Actinomycetota bacterium]
MIDPRFVFLGVAINVIAGAGYARDTLRGQTRPNRVTWLLWGVVPLVAFAAQMDAHVGLSAVMTLAAGVEPLAILAASFMSPAAAWRIGRFDLLCGGMATAGTIAWVATGKGTIAIVGAVAGDAMAALPTVIKSWRAPATESRSVFVSGIVMASLTLLTLDRFDAASTVFSIYILVMSLALTTILTVRPRSLARRDA